MEFTIVKLPTASRAFSDLFLIIVKPSRLRDLAMYKEKFKDTIVQMEICINLCIIYSYSLLI